MTESPAPTVKAYSGTFHEGLLSSFTLILVSEIGDKTFFIACLMAMRHPRVVIFTGALAALAVMTVLSAALGVIVPSLFSVRLTQIAAVFLFTVFGLKLLYEAYHHDPNDHGEDEREEAAAAVGKKDDEVGDMDANIPLPAAAPRPKGSPFFSPVLFQAFTLTFIAEWGDRSQIATIALAAAKNPWGVTLGGIAGHAICTGGAVIAGNIIASRVSHRGVMVLGGVLFIFFGAVTLFQLLHDDVAHVEPTAHP